MYVTVRRAPEPTLGAITIPSWLQSIAGAVLKGKQLQVPTPIGTQTVNLDNPAELAAIYNLLKGTKITNTPSTNPAVTSRPASFVDSIPGGWLTVAAVGVGVLLLVRRGR